jgi:His-Xaa-Ser system protein HxsD
MSASFDGIPNDLAEIDVDRGGISLRVDSNLYPLEAVYAAAYVFIDRCYVFLDRPAQDRIRVSLAPKSGALEGDAARDFVGEFANELLSCAWRAQIARENRATIEAVTAQALSGARGAPSLDELEAFDFSDEAFEDPLGIAMSWEEKYAKKKKDAAPAAEGAKADEGTAK